MQDPSENLDEGTETTPSDRPEPAIIDELVARCVDRMESEGEAVVNRICDPHPELAGRIRARLDQLRGMGLLRPLESQPEPTPTTLGPYRILDEVGRGGMGVVYLAEQQEPVHRRVAIKLLRPGMDTAEVARRFTAERQLLSRMSHPGIAQILDAGSSDTGRAYFVMEYVAGLPIHTYCDAGRLSTGDRLELFIQVCDAIEHAHQKGVLHRDLKPWNILITEEDGKPVAKVIDFGIAKAVRSELAAETLITLPGQVLGTPEYMSPEQAASGGRDVDTRTDVYSLGVVLYQILCGELPIDPERLRGINVLEMHRRLRSETPRTPSTRPDAASAASHGTDPATLRRRLRGDLDWIALRALEPDRDRRYDSVQALADDIRRHLSDEPIVAGPDSVCYRIGKLYRRHRVALVSAVVVTCALLASLVISVRYAREADRRASDFDQLAGLVRLEAAIKAQEHPYPAWQSSVERRRKWVADAERLIDMLPRLRETVREIEARPAATSNDAVRPDSIFSPAARRQARTTLFSDLIDKLERFKATEFRAARDRLWWAERIEGWTLAHPKARVTWEDAKTAIAAADGTGASELYKNVPIDLQPMSGLVPIGKNPKTKLWEFYHLRSAWDPSGVDPGEVEIPTHAPDGSIEVTEATGIVFVLLPGGPFWMGAQSTDPEGRMYCKDAERGEVVLRQTAEPVLVARHEMTQGQWLRLVGSNPSKFYPVPGKPILLTHPVETIDFVQSNRLLAGQGLGLLTEIGWEYACRAGTETTWHSGGILEDLRLVANVSDKSAGREFGWTYEDWDDGFMEHSPVGSFAANDFGLYDMHGNIWELCANPAQNTDFVPVRGGSWKHHAKDARSAKRGMLPKTFKESEVGFRAARQLVHPDDGLAR